MIVRPSDADVSARGAVRSGRPLCPCDNTNCIELGNGNQVRADARCSWARLARHFERGAAGYCQDVSVSFKVHTSISGTHSNTNRLTRRHLFIGPVRFRLLYRTHARELSGSSLACSAQHIEGHEVCFFAMYVQEYGSDCPEPNTNRVCAERGDERKELSPTLMSRASVLVPRAGTFRISIRCGTSNRNQRDIARPFTTRFWSTIWRTHVSWASRMRTSGSPLPNRATTTSFMLIQCAPCKRSCCVVSWIQFLGSWLRSSLASSRSNHSRLSQPTIRSSCHRRRW